MIFSFKSLSSPPSNKSCDYTSNAHKNHHENPKSLHRYENRDCVEKIQTSSNVYSNEQIEISKRKLYFPKRINQAKRPALRNAIASLPPLQSHILERPRLFLGYGDMSSVIGIEEIIQYSEVQPSPRKLDQFHLNIPKKCCREDERPLMPCQSLCFRMQNKFSLPSFGHLIHSNQFAEPIRNREKQWRDELHKILLGEEHYGNTYPMTSTRQKVGKWKHKVNTTEAQSSPTLLIRKGIMVSSYYAIVSILGSGIHGRLYAQSVGMTSLTDTKGEYDKYIYYIQKRELQIIAYLPTFCGSFFLNLTMKDLETLFSDRKDYLVAGKKAAILHELVQMLYFENSSSLGEGKLTDISTTKQPEANTMNTTIVGSPCAMLRIGKIRCMSDASLRRIQKEERLRSEEKEKARRLAAFLLIPKRRRYRCYCRVSRVNGYLLVISIYCFPRQEDKLVIKAYGRANGQVLLLTVDKRHVASLCSIDVALLQPFSRNNTAIKGVFDNLIRMISLRSIYSSTQKTYLTALSVPNCHYGPLDALLQLPSLRTYVDDMNELRRKRIIEYRVMLGVSLKEKVGSLQRQQDDVCFKLDEQISSAEKRLTTMAYNITELSGKIEDLDKGVAITVDESNEEFGAMTPTERKSLRRTYKTSKLKIKEEIAATKEKVIEWKSKKSNLVEQTTIAIAKLERQMSKKLDLHMSKDSHNSNSTHNCKWKSRQNSLAVGCFAFGQQKCLSHSDHVHLHKGICKIEGMRYLYALHSTVSSTLDTKNKLIQHESGLIKDLHLIIYNTERSIEWISQLHRLEFLCLTKDMSSAYLRIPYFKELGSDSALQIKKLDEDFEAHIELCRSSYEFATKSIKISKFKPIIDKKSWAILLENRKERRRILFNSPWKTLVQCFCDRLHRHDVQCNRTEFVIDRCVFRSALPILLMDQITDNETTHSEEGALYCYVNVLLESEEIVFFVYSPNNCCSWTIPHPNSVRIMRDIEASIYVEQQFTFEALVMSLALIRVQSSGVIKLQIDL